MSVALSGNAPATFEIKSANLPLVALLLKSADLTQFAQELQQRYGDMPAFFDNDPLLIDLSLLPDTVAAIDFAALANTLRPYSLLPIAVRGGRDELIAQAQAAGLVLATDAIVQRSAAAATSSLSTPVAPAAPQRTPSGSGRVVRGQVYSYMKDGVRHYSSRPPSGGARAMAVSARPATARAWARCTAPTACPTSP